MTHFIDLYNEIRRGYYYYETGGTGFFRLPSFIETGIANHGFSTRAGGVSDGCFSSLNLSFTRQDDPRENVMENYRRFASAAEIPWESMVMDSFEHGNTVLAVNSASKGAGYINGPLPPCDGLVTNDASIALITGHADCLPLFFLDTANRAIGLAHAGYQGTLKQIAKNVIIMMSKTYNSRPEDMLTGIGPCICGRCYEVDEELSERFRKSFPSVPFFTAIADKPGKAYIDLAMITAAQFLECGIKTENITLMDVCTFEDEKRLYSYRRDKGNTGGMAAYLKLTDSPANA